MTILVVPSGTLGYPISEGTISFDPYPEDPADPHSRWLVDVPPAVADRLLHNGGFSLMDQEHAPIPGMVRLQHSEAVGCSFAGNFYEPDENGTVLVPASAAAELSSHGFRAPSAAPAPQVSAAAVEELRRQIAERDAEVTRLSAAAQGRDGGAARTLPRDRPGTPHPDVPVRNPRAR